MPHGAAACAVLHAAPVPTVAATAALQGAPAGVLGPAAAPAGAAPRPSPPAGRAAPADSVLQPLLSLVLWARLTKRPPAFHPECRRAHQADLWLPQRRTQQCHALAAVDNGLHCRDSCSCPTFVRKHNRKLRHTCAGVKELLLLNIAEIDVQFKS